MDIQFIIGAVIQPIQKKLYDKNNLSFILNTKWFSEVNLISTFTRIWKLFNRFISNPSRWMSIQLSNWYFKSSSQLKLSNFLSDYISELKMINTSVTIVNYFNADNIKSLQNAESKRSIQNFQHYAFI